jgi:MFS family permease
LYAEILRLPGAAAFCVAALVTRAGGAMMSIGTVMMITGIYGSYGLAGAVVAVNGVGWSIGAAFLGNLVDRYGQRRIMLPSSLISCGSLGLLVVAGSLRLAPWTLFLLTFISGATAGTVGAYARARWAFVARNQGQLHAALSLESTLDELTFVVGPVVATVLATQVADIAGLIPPVVLGALGALWFYNQRATEPPVRPRASVSASVPDGAEAVGGVGGGGGASAGEVDGAGGAGGIGYHGPILFSPGVLPVAVATLLVGIGFGAIDVSVVAAVEAWGNKADASWVLALMSLGSALAGLLYGTKVWRLSLPKRWVISMTALAAGFACYPVMPSAVVLGIFGFVAGATVAPTFINANSLVQVMVPNRRLTEGLAWIATGVGVGCAAGAAIAGRLIDAYGYRVAFFTVLTAGAGALAITVLSAKAVNRAVRAGAAERGAMRRRDGG